ncbi:MAG TPA: trypsin-like peptidase domain-containing protein, partial [Nitrososphaeraceae archaeon]|nr:trypsin-like peptidase domain-containing protein [Nitrososphaeraceae archaeon]
SASSVSMISDTTNVGDSDSDNILSSIFDNVSNSIVQVVSVIPPLFNLNPQAQNTTEVGAGFIYDDVGHIVTGNHVLAGANNVSVVFKDGDRYNATVIGRDAFTDTAVIKIIANNTTALSETSISFEPVTLGNSSSLRIGDHVVTIGYPFASKIAMTAGIIGQTDYLLYFPFLGYSVPNTILTDVAVNPGNSGGPLINMRGDVIGMIYGRLNPTAPSPEQFPGLSVAIPSDTLDRVANGLIQNGFYIHPAVGITGSTLTVDLAKQFNDIQDDLEGVLVDTVVRGGTADMAGIDAATTNKYGERQSGDVITALDGKSIVDIEGLLSYVQENKTIGEDILFTVYRDGAYLNLSAPLQPIK